MDVSVRKCRSLWDSEEDSSHHGLDIKNTWAAKGDYLSHDGRSFKEQGSSKADSSSKRHSGWNHSPRNSLLQSCQRIRKDVERLEKEDHKREKLYCENVSPTFDGLRQQRNNKFSEHGLSQPHRLPGRGRSRSPGRAKGRSRSRSWSRDREWRSRSRSRSRSRDKGNLRDRRSRCSPPNYNVDSFECDRRQIGSRMSSKVCRDFAVGRCRRGGECWFFHPDNFKVKDGYSSEHNLTERWSGMHRNGDVSRYANSDSETIENHCQGKIPDGYDIENDQPRNTRGIITCKDFGRGNCRWGASCRFSHSGFSGQIYDGSVRNASSDYNWKPEPSKTSRPLCKYFVAGKCYTANCRFSHDGPIRINAETSPSNDIGGHRYDDKKHNLVGLKWDDVEMDSSFNKAPIGENVAKSNHLDTVHTDRVDPIGDPELVNPKKLWNESAWDVDTAKMSNLEKTSEQVDTTVRENSAITVPVDHKNNRWAHNLESERAMWQNTTLCEGRDVYPNVTATNTSEYSLESLSNNKECNVVSKASQLQSLGGSSVHGERQDTMEDASRVIFHSNAILPYGSPNPHLEAYPFWSTGNSNISNPINDVNMYRHSIHPELLPEQKFSEISKRANQGSEYSSFLDGAAQGEPTLHANLSNGHSIMPNDSMDYQKKEAATTSEVLHFSMTQNLSGATFSVPTTRMQSPAPLTDEIWHESGKSQQHAAVPASAVCTDSNSGLLPTFNAVYTRLDPVQNAPDLCQVAQTRDYESQMPDNIAMHVNASNLSEQGTKDTLKELNQSSSLNSEVGNIKQCAASNVDCTKEQYLTHPNSGAKSEVNENNRLISKYSEDEQHNNNPDNVDVPGKCEVVNGNKDAKVARLFKISLIESVKEILKPTWKEGRMSREVHKTIVKKVVDKVMGSIQGGHFPKTQDKIEHYLSNSKAKISKLAQAYVERSRKENS